MVFFKDWLYGKIELVKTDNVGILWMKLQREFFSLERDIYISLTYIPPEESNVYKNREYSLFEFDFFEKLSDDLRVYKDLGDIFLCGDLNSRIGSKADFVEDLSIVFNKIYDNGTYPDEWTKGIIVPIFKKGAKDIPSNYRGITPVNTMARLFSLCLTDRLYKYCESDHLFTDLQFGFREKKGTVDYLYFTLYYTKVFSQE